MIFTYDSKHKKDVLDAFKLKVQDGFVVDKTTGNPIKDNLNGQVTMKKFGGVRKGSLEFINKDVASLLKLRNKLKQDS